MKRFPFRPVLIGIAAGAVLFFASFILFRILLFVLIVGGLARLAGRSWRRGFRGSRYGGYQRWRMPYDAGNGPVLSLGPRAARNIAIE